MSYLSELIANKLIPQLQNNVAERFIVAKPRMLATQMPPGVELIFRKITGKRVVPKGHRFHSTSHKSIALWPEMNLNEVGAIKMAYVLNGYVDYQLGNYRIKCGAGNCIVIPPGMPHPDGYRSYLDVEKCMSTEVLFFMLHSNAISCWVSSLKANGGKQWKGYLLSNPHLTMLFQVLAEELIHEGRASYPACSHLLVGFSSLLLQEANSGMIQPFMGVSDERSSQLEDQRRLSNSFTANLEDYIQRNIHRKLTLDKAAYDMFFSRTQFIRTVRRETGKTFNEFLTDLRIANAKHLLEESDWTIYAISRFTGFNSASYFNTIFKKHVGERPTQYRANHQKSKK